MKRLLLVGEQVCRTFKANNLAAEIQTTVATVDIEKERQYMDCLLYTSPSPRDA